MPEAAERQEIQIPEGLEQRLSALVDRLEAEERVGKVHLRNSRVQPNRSRWVAGLAVAAVAVGLAFIVLTPRGGGRVIEVDDPEEARIQTERALNLLASTLNKGVKGMERAEKETAVFTERIRGLR